MKIGNPLAAFINEEAITKSQEQADEKRKLLKELLGVELNRPELAASFNPYESLMDFLPEGKMTSLMEMDQKYAARLMKTVKAANQGDVGPMLEVQAEKDAEMIALLGPEAKKEYDLRLSQTAVMMRMKLTDFQPTEAEFRQMFDLQKAFDDQYGPYGVRPKGSDERAEFA